MLKVLLLLWSGWVFGSICRITKNVAGFFFVISDAGGAWLIRWVDSLFERLAIKHFRPSSQIPWVALSNCSPFQRTQISPVSASLKPLAETEPFWVILSSLAPFHWTQLLPHCYLLACSGKVIWMKKNWLEFNPNKREVMFVHRGI